MAEPAGLLVSLASAAGATGGDANAPTGAEAFATVHTAAWTATAGAYLLE